jgi:3-oxoacyl-[acyl-carrier protein] reductase
MLAVVTGGSRGIGAAISRVLLDEKYICLIVARKETEAVIQMKNDYPDNVDFFSCDISDERQRKALFLYISEKYGRIDILINDAGVAPRVRKDMLEITEDDFDFLMNINLKGTFFVTQAAAAMMGGVNGGRIINISSVSADTVSVNRAEYCISKAGISMITQLFSVRLAEKNIGVFEIRPGIIETDMTEKVKDKYEKMIADGLTPIARMGKPEDVAKCVSSIARGDFDFCTGTVICADGGLHIKRL